MPHLLFMVTQHRVWWKTTVFSTESVLTVPASHPAEIGKCLSKRRFGEASQKAHLVAVLGPYKQRRTMQRVPELFVVVDGWNGFTDCSAINLKAFNSRAVVAADHNAPLFLFFWVLLLSSPLLSSVISFLDLLSVLQTITILRRTHLKKKAQKQFDPKNGPTESIAQSSSRFWYRPFHASVLVGLLIKGSSPLYSGPNVFSSFQLDVGFFFLTGPLVECCL